MAGDDPRDILVMVPPAPAQLARLEAGFRVHRLDQAADPEALLAAVASGVEAVMTDGHTGLGADLIARLPRLGLVASGSAGLEGIDAEALRARGIPLVNSAPALADEVADLAMLLLLAAWRGLAGLEAHARGPWARGEEAPLGRSLAGRRLGLLGMGTIGRAIARRADAFGLAIAYASRSPKPVPYPHEPDPVALARGSDALVVVVPGGPATRGLVSAAVIDALGPGGVLVNVARGSVVDEPALIDALAAGRLGAAGLDVVAGEPRVDPRLAALPNVVLTPHVGSATVETREAMARLVVDNIEAHFAGRALLSPVPPGRD